eukprot:6167888-Alexandrium_andersonii.AAC.1
MLGGHGRAVAVDVGGALCSRRVRSSSGTPSMTTPSCADVSGAAAGAAAPPGAAAGAAAPVAPASCDNVRGAAAGAAAPRGAAAGAAAP